MAVAEDLCKLEAATERAEQRPLAHESTARAEGDIRRGLGQRAGEGAGEEIDHEEGLAVGLAHPLHANDATVLQSEHDLGLALEISHGHAVLGVLHLEQLDRHLLAVEIRPIHRAELAAA